MPLCFHRGVFYYVLELIQIGIQEITQYLVVFLKNLLLSENNKLHNRILNISGLFKFDKVDIECFYYEKLNSFSKKAVGPIKNV